MFELKTINELIDQYPLFLECWESYSHAKISMDSPYKDFMDDPRMIGMDYSKCRIPIPLMTHMYVCLGSGLNDVEMKDPSEKIALQLHDMTINTPTPVINTRLVSASYVNYLVTYSPCTLMLRDVIDIPSYIGKFADDDVFLWSIPVDKVYLYKCPQIDPRFLKLPYVETFEEKGWFV